MKPKTIVHPEALADWRANDERPHKINTGETSNASTREHSTHNNKVSKKQTKLEGLLALRLKEAIERETGKRRTVRKEGEA
jgi:endo-beta-N-acetylglucosaminidase D